MKVIVADDSILMRQIITGLVESIGFETLHATNGQEVLDLLEKGGEDVCLLLLDWNMPVMDGIETLEAMQKNSHYKSTPVVMVSTESEENSIARAIDAGAKGYITKPFTQEDLAAKIKEVLI